MVEALEARVDEFGSSASIGSWFLSKEHEIDGRPALLPYSHYLRQAWTELNLSGILCVDGRPTVYVCAASRFSHQQKRERHRFAWNQGLVPLLLFITPNQVEVHSTLKKPEKDPVDGELFGGDLASLIPNLGNIADALEAAKLVRSIETGQFFQDHALFFPTTETVDRCLIENLLHTARRLKTTGWSLAEAHSLLGRALFVCFLQERKFIKPTYYPDGTSKFLDVLRAEGKGRAKHLLYQEFFARLQAEFNGTMFDSALGDEERRVSDTQLSILADFLSGDDMKSGQMTLGFWAYDFRFIPVEIISAIYEEFMKDTDLAARRKDGAYYTPRHLAETTLHIALESKYEQAKQWRILDPACGSGIFLVAMFNLLAEQWRRSNSSTRKQTKAQALLDILLTRIRGIDLNGDACRITAFSLYLALFEKLSPMDVEEFKQKVKRGPFLPNLLWDGKSDASNAVIFNQDFVNDSIPLRKDFDLVIGNPPWESRGESQIALHFVRRSKEFLRSAGTGCFLLPSAILVNRHGTLDGEWFRAVTVEKIVQLADFRFVLFEATHPCFILRYLNTKPALEHTILYETPKLSRFDRRQGVIVVEPDDQKLVPQYSVIEGALQNRLQSIWSRKFWGTPRDESFLRRLDFYPKLSDSAKKRKWGGGVGCKPYYPGASQGKPWPLHPWKLSDKFLSNREDFPPLVLHSSDLLSLKEALENSVHRQRNIKASLKYLHRKPGEDVFTPPMVVYSKGFTKSVFCNIRGKLRFFDGLRSITGPKRDEDMLRFLSVVLGSRLFRYITFHSGSNSGIGRDQIHLYESRALPFPLPDDELAPSDAASIVREAASLTKGLEREEQKTSVEDSDARVHRITPLLERLVEAYFSVTEPEKILIEDTLSISQPSIHRSSLDGEIPSLAFPDEPARKQYADTLCNVLNRRTRRQGIKIRAEGLVSKPLNLVFVSVIFGHESRPYTEGKGDDDLWKSLERVGKAAEQSNGSFSYLRGFSYFDPDRLHLLKPATLRNWSRTAALNDADAVFEHLVSRQSA